MIFENQDFFLTIYSIFHLLHDGCIPQLKLALWEADIPCDSRAFGRSATCCEAEATPTQVVWLSWA